MLVKWTWWNRGKMLRIICLINLLFLELVNAQLEISVFTDKDSYEYGEKIILSCEVTNPADTTFEFFAPSYQSCQAAFYFNDFNSWKYTECYETTELLIFKPHSSKNLYMGNWS